MRRANSPLPGAPSPGVGVGAVGGGAGGGAQGAALADDVVAGELAGDAVKEVALAPRAQILLGATDDGFHFLHRAIGLDDVAVGAAVEGADDKLLGGFSAGH